MNPNLLGVDHATATALKRLLNRGIGEENLSKDVVGKLNAGKTALKTALKKYSATIGDGSATSITVVHNLGTEDIIYSLREISSKAFVDTDVSVVDLNTIKLSFAIAPAANSLRLVVIG